jgi:predicted RNA-binding protein (virulence factor B family)
MSSLPGGTPHDLLGRSERLVIRRIGAHGAFLAIDADDERPGAATVLLPGGELPEGAQPGDELDVFVYLDSEDRPIATTREPKLELGEVSFLQVTACTSFGAFVDWGLLKELLVPFAEQTKDLRPGDVHPIGLYIDNSQRLAGTMRISEMLDTGADFELDEWVEGEAWRKDPEIGLFVIVERRAVGLLPVGEPHNLSRGQAARFRVSRKLDGGKIELSLRGRAHEELAGDAQKILELLSRPGAERVGDASSPEEIRQLFGMSKKAFKRAVGSLLKRGQIRIDVAGFVVPVVQLDPGGGRRPPKG